jgi:hypothetical protein
MIYHNIMMLCDDLVDVDGGGTFRKKLGSARESILVLPSKFNTNSCVFHFYVPFDCKN